MMSVDGILYKALIYVLCISAEWLVLCHIFSVT